MGYGDQQFIVMMIPHSATSKGGKGNPPSGGGGRSAGSPPPGTGHPDPGWRASAPPPASGASGERPGPSRLERSRGIHGNPPVDILGEAVENVSRRLKHLAMGIFSLLLLLGLVCAAYTGAVANSKGHAEGPDLGSLAGFSSVPWLCWRP